MLEFLEAKFLRVACRTVPLPLRQCVQLYQDSVGIRSNADDNDCEFYRFPKFRIRIVCKFSITELGFG